MHSTRQCSVQDCARKFYGRGWCRNHYNALVKQHSPEELGLPACSVPGCGKTHYGRGFCRMHWERDYLKGDPGGLANMRREPPLERIARYTRPDGDCLVWTGSTSAAGYGQTSHNGRPAIASRYAYEAYHGPIPDGLVVRHKCDNPPCVKREHLELGTYADNSLDMAERGRGGRGVLNPAAKITAADAERIRELAASGTKKSVLARQYGLGETQVGRIVRGESWPATYRSHASTIQQNSDLGVNA